MKDADEILDDELSDAMVAYLTSEPTFRGWIKDAMYAFAEQEKRAYLKQFLKWFDAPEKLIDHDELIKDFESDFSPSKA